MIRYADSIKAVEIVMAMNTARKFMLQLIDGESSRVKSRKALTAKDVSVNFGQLAGDLLLPKIACKSQIAWEKP